MRALHAAAALVPFGRLKVLLLRLGGARIGRGVRLRRGVRLFVDDLQVGDGAVLEPHVKVVCRRLHMGPHTKIDSETTVYGAGELHMGEGSYIGPRAWINPESRIVLGAGTGVGPGSSIFTHGVWLSFVEGFPRRFADVELGDGVWVPANVTILPGVRIGDGAIVGAGAVVAKDVEAGAFVAGVPAKPSGRVADLMAASDGRQERLDTVLEAWRAREGGTPGAGPVRFTVGRGRTAVVVLPPGAAPATAADAVAAAGAREAIVVADGLPSAVRDVLGRRAAWFDVRSGEARLGRVRAAKALRDYLGSHWGVRFQDA